MADSNNYMYRRMMREAMMDGGRSGGGNDVGLLGQIAQGVTAYRHATQERQDEDTFTSTMKSNIAAGMDPRKALMSTLAAHPELLVHPAFEDHTGQLLNEILHPPSRQVFAASPGSTLYDSEGNQLGTVPGKSMNLPSEAVMALMAAGWQGQGDPTPEQWSKAQSFAGRKFQGSELDQLRSTMTPQQWQGYLQKLSTPPGNTPSPIHKLMQERDALTAAGRTQDAAKMQQAIDKLATQGGFGQLMQALNNQENGDNGGNNAAPGANPVPIPGSDNGGSGGDTNGPSPGQQALRNQAISTAMTQALQTGKAVPWQDIDGTTRMMTVDTAQMLQQQMTAGSADNSTPPPPPPEKPPVPQPQQ